MRSRFPGRAAPLAACLLSLAALPALAGDTTTPLFKWSPAGGSGEMIVKCPKKSSRTCQEPVADTEEKPASATAAPSPEEERLQQFWSDYYGALKKFYSALHDIDWVTFYKNHGLPNHPPGLAGSGPITCAPYFVEPPGLCGAPPMPPMHPMRSPGPVDVPNCPWVCPGMPMPHPPMMGGPGPWGVPVMHVEPEQVPSGPKNQPAALVELLKGYDRACAEGRTNDARKLARAALILDPTCFHGKR